MEADDLTGCFGARPEADEEDGIAPIGRFHQRIVDRGLWIGGDEHPPFAGHTSIVHE